MSVKYCPSCGSESIELKGDRVCCLECNATFEVKADGSSKVVDDDPIDRIADRVLAKMSSKKTEPPASPPANPVPAQEVNSEEQDGFINFGDCEKCNG